MNANDPHTLRKFLILKKGRSTIFEVLGMKFYSGACLVKSKSIKRADDGKYVQ